MDVTKRKLYILVVIMSFVVFTLFSLPSLI
jgi:hypothetical protein